MDRICIWWAACNSCLCRCINATSISCNCRLMQITSFTFTFSCKYSAFLLLAFSIKAIFFCFFPPRVWKQQRLCIQAKWRRSPESSRLSTWMHLKRELQFSSSETSAEIFLSVPCVFWIVGVSGATVCTQVQWLKYTCHGDLRFVSLLWKHMWIKDFCCLFNSVFYLLSCTLYLLSVNYDSPQMWRCLRISQPLTSSVSVHES